MSSITSLLSGASPVSVLMVALVFVLAGAVKGAIGLGLPTVAIALLGTRMAPAEAAALLIVPSLVTNLWQLAAGARLRPLAARLRPMLIGICIGTLAGAGMLDGRHAAGATAFLGAILIVYAAAGLTAFRIAAPANGDRRWERRLSPLVGAATGLVTAATGVFVMPAVPYLQALGFDKDELVQAMGLSFTVSTLALAAGLALAGGWQPSAAGASALALLPALLGMRLGQAIRARVPAAAFRRGFFVVLLLLGAHLVIKGAAG